MVKLQRTASFLVKPNIEVITAKACESDLFSKWSQKKGLVI